MQHPPTFETNHQELLQTCRTKLELGDSFGSIYAFLRKRDADEETTKLIISILDLEDKARRTKEAPRKRRIEKISGIVGGLFSLIGGTIVILLSWYFLNRGLEAGYIFFLPAAGLLIGGSVALGGIIKTIAFLLKH